MEPSILCPKCGKPLSADAPQGLCPECLLKTGLVNETLAEKDDINAWKEPTSGVQIISPGTRVQYFGDYELLEEIARGGMGVVWKARQTSLKRIVALKTIRAGVLASREEVQRFLREAEAAANLQHPNIVAIHEIGEHEGQHFFSMDYVEGSDLGAHVQKGPMAPQRAARYVRIIAEAIHFAHQRGTLHRDLKPQNVLIDAADRPRITDFGLAKHVNQDARLTQTGAVLGSPSYMPPEQALGWHDKVGPASDVYSLGAILYELLTGRPPFIAATALATLQATIDSDPAPPRSLNGDVPPDLETICLKCLEKGPLNRYSSARDLAEDLGRFLQGEPIHARPAGIVRKTVSWGRRHPGVLAAAAALVIVGLVFSGVYLIEENRFLRAQMEDASLVRRPGPRTEVLRTLATVNLWAILFGIATMGIACYRHNWAAAKEVLEPAMPRPQGPMGEFMRTLVACVGLTNVGLGLVFLAHVIQAQVWEKTPGYTNFTVVFWTIWCGLWLLYHVVRDYRWATFGPPSRALTPERLEEVRKAIFNGDEIEAVQLYRDAIPQAGFVEAREFVQRLTTTMRTEFPEKFRRPTLSLASLNWSAMSVCLLLQIALVALCLIAFPPREWAPVAIYFMAGFVFGLGIMVSAAIHSRGLQMLTFIPGLGLFVLAGFSLESISFGEIAWPTLIGLLFGLTLLITGYTKRRGSASR